MPAYIWKGINAYGNKTGGEVEATDLDAAEKQVKRMRISNVVIQKKPKKDIFAAFPFLQPKVTEKDIVIFTRQLSTIINAGLPLVNGLKILERQQNKAVFKTQLAAIRKEVESGTTLADAMRRHPETFNKLFTNMIEAGETAGILDMVLSRLTTFMEKNISLKNKIKGSLVYPLACLIISSVIVIVILVFVVPVFKSMFEGFGHSLPLLTQLVVSASEWVTRYIFYILLGMLFALLLLRKLYNIEKFRKISDRALLHFPVLGDLVKKVAIAQITRTLGAMLSAGVPILEAIKIVGKTAGNKVIENAVYQAGEAVAAGRPLSEPLSASGVFPDMVIQMINVGDSVGALDTMLEKIAVFYDEEVEQAVANLTSMIEPVMMVFLGGLIGGIVVAMYLPIFKLSNVMM